MMQNQRKHEKGNVMVMFSMMMLTLVLLMAILFELGFAYLIQYRAQNALDFTAKTISLGMKPYAKDGLVYFCSYDQTQENAVCNTNRSPKEDGDRVFDENYNQLLKPYVTQKPIITYQTNIIEAENSIGMLVKLEMDVSYRLFFGHLIGIKSFPISIESNAASFVK